jgi:hypothetical protein
MADPTQSFGPGRDQLIMGDDLTDDQFLTHIEAYHRRHSPNFPELRFEPRVIERLLRIARGRMSS